jgi:hypothetical protein
MSQTRQLSVNLGNTVRVRRSDGATSGSGNSQRLYVGYYGGYDYDSFIRFTMNWTDVGRIVSAVLSLYTDDGNGIMDSTTNEHPYVIIRRLTSAFTEGTSPSSSFQTDDYTTASRTTSDQRTANLTRAVFGLNNIDITDMFEDWAPVTVKRRNGMPGGAAANHGIALLGSADGDATKNWAGFSEDYTDPTYRPIITLTYEYGATVPSTPTNLTPSGAVAALTDFQGDFADLRPTDTLSSSEVQVYAAGAVKSGTGVASNNNISVTAHGYVAGQRVWFHSLTGGVGLSVKPPYYVRQPNANAFLVSLTPTGPIVDITTNYSALTVASPIYSVRRQASATEISNDRFAHVPDSLPLTAGVTYQWRARVYDNEGQFSLFTSLTNFSVSNTVPTAPVLSPVTASSFATLDGVLFRGGTFSDPDAGDTLLAYQVQMSAYASGDSHWDDDQYILWNTGKVYVTDAATSWETPYGGADLQVGTYYWRARNWDNKQGYSDWSYASIDVTTGYEPDPDVGQTAIQLRPRAPWRIVIKAMGSLRGPGAVVGVIEDAKNVGASILFNSPGELHFTLLKDHAQIAVIEPKQTHYSVQFRQGDGWREVFAGLMWDFDASDTDVVFYGIDYLSLLDYVIDERYDASNPDRPAEQGGSKYVTAGKNSISYIVTDQLTRAKALPNSPVGFITVGTVASMTETLTVFSTYAPTLNFVTGLLDSHRAGTGKKTRLSVRQKTGGGYEFVVQDDPGQVRDNLRMRYGELVQGYRVIPFGTDWASRINAIGRGKDGIKVMYKTAAAPGISEGTWGRFAQARIVDGVSDENDLMRRTKQAAVHAGRLGKSIALGLRSGILQPRDGYDVCDIFPIDIEDGSVSTDAFGSGYWIAVGVTWTSDAQTGKQATTLTLSPRDDTVAPDTDLLTLQPIHPQVEWEVGTAVPDPTQATGYYYVDSTTGTMSVRVPGTTVATGITGTV